MQILIGSDPEVFATHNNNFVSAHGLIPGSKEHPHPVNNGAVQVDGMALEFNIDPADSEDTFVFNINSVLAQLEAMVPDHKLSITPVAEFGMAYIKSQPDEAQELGCDPDFNAWTGEVNTPPDVENTFRTAAGHVHLGWTSDRAVDDEMFQTLCQRVVRQLDFFLGLPSLVYDAETKRREMYGKAGAYRIKPYGVEYRVLSNAWLKEEAFTRWVFRASQAAVLSVKAGEDLDSKWGDIQHIINTSDVEAALNIIEEEGLEVPNVSE